MARVFNIFHLSSLNDAVMFRNLITVLQLREIINVTFEVIDNETVKQKCEGRTSKCHE